MWPVLVLRPPFFSPHIGPCPGAVQANALPNPQGLALALAPYRTQKSNSSYIGCMKSGLVITDYKSPWYEPQSWKFGGVTAADGLLTRNYMLHATANGYALSRGVALYLATNADVLAVCSHVRFCGSHS
jgi:hypothetical protein